MNKKTFILIALILLLSVPAADAWSWNPATWISRAFKIGDSKDIDLNGNAVGNGYAWNLTCGGNCTNFNGTTGADGSAATNYSNITTGRIINSTFLPPDVSISKENNMPVLILNYTGTNATLLNNYMQTPGISEILIYGNMTSEQVTIPSNIHRIGGTGTIWSNTTGSPILYCENNKDLTITGLAFVGKGAVYNNTDRAVYINTSNDIKIQNLNISKFSGDGGILLNNVTIFSVNNNHISEQNYSAITLLSTSYGVVSDNIIENVTKNVNAYGIALTRVLSTNPVSHNITVSGNVMKGIAWEGVSTHSGRDITISSNTFTNVSAGIGVGPTSGTGAPKRITVSNNNGGAISFTGVSLSDPITGTITGNRFTDYNAASGGLLVLEYSYGVAVMGNSFYNSTGSGGNGFYGIDNVGISITGNTFTNISQTGIYFDFSQHSSGAISGNTIDSYPTKTAAEGIRLGEGDITSSPIRVCGNYINATIALIDTSARAVNCSANNY